jgi:hypothetical protein
VVWHLVLLKTRAGLSNEERRALVSAFQKAVGEISTVRDVRVGRRISHGAGYETAAPDIADFMVSIAFDDLAGLQAYLNHPAHQELGRLFAQSVSLAPVYDFVVDGIEGLKSWEIEV